MQKESHPTTQNCPKGASHNWITLGEVGAISYQCTKCSTILSSKGNPVAGYCSKGNSHNWRKL